MKLIFENVTAKNFLSIGSNTQAIDFIADGLTLVLGENTDPNGNITRNGVGKSAILQALSYAWYGKPLFRIKLGNLVNNINAKNMLVTSTASKDGVKSRVERGQKPGVLRWFVNEAEIKAKTETGDDEAQGENAKTQDEIERYLGMSHDMFKQAIALNTFTEPFLKMKAAEQREIIEELMGITQLSQRAAALKLLMDRCKDTIRDHEAAIKATMAANDRVQAAIDHALTLSSRWDRDHVQAIADLEGAIAAVAAIDFDAEIAQFERLDAFVIEQADLARAQREASQRLAEAQLEKRTAEAEVAHLQREKSALDPSRRVERLSADHARATAEITRQEMRYAELRVDLGTAQAQAEGADSSTCVCCNQSLAGTDHLVTVKANLIEQVTAIAAKTALAEAEIARARAAAQDLLTERSAILDDAVTAIAQVQDRLNSALETLERLAAVVDTLQGDVAAATAVVAAQGPAPTTLFDTRDDAYKARQDFDQLTRDLAQERARSNPYTEQIEQRRSEIVAIDREPVVKAGDTLKHQEFLFKLLTSKESFIRKKIIEQNLAYLNARLSNYLDKLGLPHEVKFLSDLSIEIAMLGRDFDFEQLSRGEMNRVILAMSWSFRDVWESLNHPVNLVWVDEMLDFGLDDQGAEAGLDVLKKMVTDRAKNVFLISHKENLRARVERTLLVKKENSFTRFEQGAGD
jgi:DNA repair exonuclease SbcCD ATPase subunit